MKHSCKMTVTVMCLFLAAELSCGEGTAPGRGKLTLPDGSSYEGEIKGGKANGYGVRISAAGKYEGEFSDNKADGRGRYTGNDGIVYEGGYKNNKADGKGVLTVPNGERYEGSFSDGLFNGQGVYTWPGGSKYEGAFKNGKFDGKGKYTYVSPAGGGDIIRSGIWKEGVYQGEQ